MVKQPAKNSKENHLLRFTLWYQNGAACENCKNLKAHLEKKDQTIKEKNRTLEELNLVCSRYEVQLKQQEELLKQWQDVKGRVLIFDKWFMVFLCDLL